MCICVEGEGDMDVINTITGYILPIDCLYHIYHWAIGLLAFGYWLLGYWAIGLLGYWAIGLLSELTRSIRGFLFP